MLAAGEQGVAQEAAAEAQRVAQEAAAAAELAARQAVSNASWRRGASSRELTPTLSNQLHGTLPGYRRIRWYRIRFSSAAYPGRAPGNGHVSPEQTVG